MPYEKTLEKQAIDNRARRARERGRIHDAVPGEDRGFSSPRECPIFDELDLDTVGPFTLNYKLSGVEPVHAADVGVVTLVTQAETETSVGADLGGFSGSDAGSAVDDGAFNSQEGEITVGIDAGSLTATFLGTDSTAGADDGVVGISNSDTGSGVDAAGAVIGVSTGDAGSGADAGTTPSVSFTDDFNRTAVPMGNGWTDQRGAFGCNGSVAYLDGTSILGDNIATQDLGANGTCQVTLATVPGSGQIGLVVRFSDLSNYWKWVSDSGGAALSLYQVSGGVATLKYASSAAVAPGDVLKVVLSSGTIDVYYNGTPLHSEGDLGFASIVGLLASTAAAGTAEWDDFSFL